MDHKVHFSDVHGDVLRPPHGTNNKPHYAEVRGDTAH